MDAQDGGNRIHQIRFHRAEFAIGQMIKHRHPAEEVRALGHGNHNRLPNRWIRPIFLARNLPVDHNRPVIILQVQISYQRRKFFIIHRTVAVGDYDRGISGHVSHRFIGVRYRNKLQRKTFRRQHFFQPFERYPAQFLVALRNFQVMGKAI